MTPQQIINDVAHCYGITENELMHGDKHRRYAEPRHVAAYLLRNMLHLSFPAIARMFGKTHVTIIYSVNKVHDWVGMPFLNPEAVNCINKLNHNQ